MFDYPSKRAEKAAQKGSVEGFKSALRHNAKTEALKKKTGMYTSPTGSRHRVGSQKHKYWEAIQKRTADNERAGVPND